jgi:hypothetical protein
VYRLAWKVAEPDGLEGHGKWLGDYEVAAAWKEAMNRRRPNMVHWVERRPGCRR